MDRLTWGTAGRVISLSLLALGAPVMAQPAAAPVPVLSDSVRMTLTGARARAASGDLNGAVAALIAALPAASVGYESYAIGLLLMEQEAKRNNIAGQRKALTVVFESGQLPTDQWARLHHLAGILSAMLGDSDDAIAQLRYAATLGLRTADGDLTLADALLRKGDARGALDALANAIAQRRAAGQAVPEPWYDRAIAVAYGARAADLTAAWMQRKLAAYPNPANWRTALVNYMTMASPPADVQLDYYRLMDVTGALASDRDVRRFAELSASAGGYAEAKMTWDRAIADGKVLKADPVYAKSATTLGRQSVRFLADMPKSAATATSADALVKAGHDHLSAGRYAEAVRLYSAAREKGAADASVLLRLGIAQARAGEMVAARQSLATVPTGTPWHALAGFWLGWIDIAAPVQAATATTAPAAN